jgi:hypothetical protein
MTIPARRRAIPSGRRLGLRGGAGNKFSLPPAPSTHGMGTRASRPFPNPSPQCPICRVPVTIYDDYLKCVAQCRKFHRRCFEARSGQPCLCRGLLCRRHAIPDRGRFPAYLNTCANCFGPAYPQDEDVISAKWMVVFSSIKFRTYMRRMYPQLFTGPHGWKAFHPDYLVVTNNDDLGRNPLDLYNVLRANGDTNQEAFKFIWEMYRISRINFSTVPGAAFELRHCLLRNHYNFLVRGPMRTFLHDPPFPLRYRFDRLLYCHDLPINDGRDDPPHMQNRVRVCKSTHLNMIIHDHDNGSSAGVWHDFRRMFERPRADWGLWN